MRRELVNQGYVLERMIQDHASARFHVGVVLSPRGEHYLFKEFNRAHPRFFELPARLENEIWWYETMRPLLKESRVNANAYRLYCPEVVKRSPQNYWYLAEYVRYPMLLDLATCSSEEVMAQGELLAGILAELDKVKSPRLLKRRLVGLDWDCFAGELFNMPALIEANAQSLLKWEDVMRAVALMTGCERVTQPFIQHTACIPEHMLVGGGEVVLIGSGRSSSCNPRYYDLAHLYAHVVAWTGNWDAGGNIMRRFMEMRQLDPEHLRDCGFLGLMTLRALSMHADALGDLERRDYRHIAQELLERCFSERVESFL